MNRFEWSLLKTLQYLTRKIPTIDLDDREIRCLLLYDKSQRDKLLDETQELWKLEKETSEEAILARNTFLNSLKKNISTSCEKYNKSKNKLLTNKKVTFI